MIFILHTNNNLKNPVKRGFAAFCENFEPVTPAYPMPHSECVVEMSREQGEELHRWLTAQLFGIKIQKIES